MTLYRTYVSLQDSFRYFADIFVRLAYVNSSINKKRPSLTVSLNGQYRKETARIVKLKYLMVYYAIGHEGEYRLSQQLLPNKAKYGAPCTGCGTCYATEICVLGKEAFPGAELPCPGLAYDARWC